MNNLQYLKLLIAALCQFLTGLYIGLRQALLFLCLSMHSRLNIPWTTCLALAVTVVLLCSTEGGNGQRYGALPHKLFACTRRFLIFRATKLFTVVNFMRHSNSPVL